jgi:hypothetical protein
MSPEDSNDLLQWGFHPVALRGPFSGIDPF